jgi:antitoxin MazE
MVSQRYTGSDGPGKRFPAAKAMITKLCRHGNSLVLVIDRAVLDLLKIDENTALDVTTDGESLVVAPVRSQKCRAQFEQALVRSNARYGKALKRLAE